jgi:hypothetical protein
MILKMDGRTVAIRSSRELCFSTVFLFFLHCIPGFLSGEVERACPTMVFADRPSSY